MGRGRDDRGGWAGILEEETQTNAPVLQGSPATSARRPVSERNTPRTRRRPIAPVSTPTSARTLDPIRADPNVPAPPANPSSPAPWTDLNAPSLRPNPNAIAPQADPSSSTPWPDPNAPSPRPARFPRVGQGLSLPAPSPRSKPPPPLSGRSTPPHFANELVEKLGATSPATRPPPGGHIRGLWKEYREVILSIVGGIAVVTAAAFYTRWPQAPQKNPNQASTRRISPSAVPPSRANPSPRPPPTRPEPLPNTPNAQAAPEKHPAPERRPTKTRTPMLSVLSHPPGALVDIGGVIYGKTPLVMPSPHAESLNITLKLGGFRTWHQVVRPSETGHFSVHVKLSDSSAHSRNR